MCQLGHSPLIDPAIVRLEFSSFVIILQRSAKIATIVSGQQHTSPKGILRHKLLAGHVKIDFRTHLHLFRRQIVESCIAVRPRGRHGNDSLLSGSGSLRRARFTWSSLKRRSDLDVRRFSHPLPTHQGYLVLFCRHRFGLCK